MSSNTGEKRGNGRFTKGDKRINRRGRPKNFDAFRTLALSIAAEAIDVKTKDGVNVRMTRIEAILRQWCMSGNDKLQRAFVEIAYGKVPDTIAGTGKDGEIVLRVIYDNPGSPSKDTTPKTE